MDTLTHTLTGLVLSRALLKPVAWRWSAPSMMLAANLPDILDLLMVGRGNGAYLRDHRGLSHAAIVNLGAALVFATLIWLALRISAGRNAAKLSAIQQEADDTADPPAPGEYRAPGVLSDQMEAEKTRAETGAPGWFAVALAIVVGVASHLPLDWLNTYGIRPWLPFNDTRYYGDALFIIDPWVWLTLGIAGYWGTRGWLGVGLWSALAVATTALVVYAWSEKIVGPNVLQIWLAAVLLAAPLRWLLATPNWAEASARVALVLVAVYVGAMHYQSGLVKKQLLVGEMATSRTDPNFAISINPVPGDPWHWIAIVQARNRLDTIDCDLRKKINQRTDRKNPNVFDPALDALDDRPDVQAWRAFARHPVVERQGKELVLGDQRYRILKRPDWTEIRIPLADDAPAAKVAPVEETKETVPERDAPTEKDVPPKTP